MARWLVLFVALCIGAIAVVYLALWALGEFSDSGLGVNGIIALTLGTILTIGLGVGLMALTFYSDRSGQDEDVNGAGRK